MINKNKYRRLIIFFFLVIIFLILPVVNIFALEPLKLTGEKDLYPVGKYLEYMGDTTQELTLEDILSEKYTNDFIKGQKDFISLPPSTSTFWIRFQLKNEASPSFNWILNYDYVQLGSIEIYKSNPDGTINTTTVFVDGLSEKPSDPDSYKTRPYVYELKLEQGESKTYYLKIADYNEVMFNIKITTWAKFYKEEGFGHLVYGLLFGILVIMILYNLFLFFTIRDWNYFFYIFILLTFIVYEMTLYGYLFQVFGHFRFAFKFFLIISCVHFITHVIFTKSFLETRKNAPKLDFILNLFIIIYSLFIIISFIIDNSTYIRIHAIHKVVVTNIFAVFLIIVGVVLLQKRVKSARYYLSAFLFFLISVIVNTFLKIGILPMGIPILYYVEELGFIIHITLLSIALGDKINIMRDEKEQAQSEAIRNQRIAMDNLKKADKMKDDFLSRTSHELKTPLNGIIGLVNDTVESVTNKLSDEELRNLTLVSNSGRRLLFLINDITDYSLLKHSEIKLYPKPVDLRQLANVVLIICSPLLAGKDIDLINNVNLGLSQVYADENRLQQILYNLVGNAIKFSEKGFIKIDAEESTEKEGYIRVSVTDTGLGIPDDKFNEVFESFTQLDNKGVEISGMGLGLNISKILIELHGGNIGVERRKTGDGTCFWFTIPIAVSHKETTESTGNKVLQEYRTLPDTREIIIDKIPIRDSIRQEHPTAKILIADDDSTNIEVLISNLREQNFDIDIVYDGLSALKKIQKEKNYDLVLLDVMMPRMSGYEVCKEARKNYSLLDLPILILTVKNQPLDIMNGLNNGANDYLTKPFNQEELVARVTTLIRLKKLSKILKNINEELEEKVKERTEKLSKANEELKLYNSIVAHDLRSPLNIIDGYIQQILDNDLNLPEKTKMEYLREIHSTEKDMMDIIKRLLDLAMINQAELNFETIDLSEVFRDSLIKLKNYDKNHNPKIFVENDMIVYGDRNMIYQMVDNLLNNAWKFTKEVEDPRITIGKIEDTETGETTYYISDNGIGFDIENPEELFEMYYKYHKNEEYEGYGIGLGIVKRIIDLHNGKIWAQSESDSGATFYFTI